MPLSEIGQYAYDHSWGLANGEKWLFVPEVLSANNKRMKFRVRLVEAITRAQVAAEFGKTAAARVQPDRKTIVLELAKIKL